MGASPPQDSPPATPGQASVPAGNSPNFRIDDDLLSLIRSLLDSRNGSQTAETPSTAVQGSPQGLPLSIPSCPPIQTAAHRRGSERVADRLYSSAVQIESGGQPAEDSLRPAQGRVSLSPWSNASLPAHAMEATALVRLLQRQFSAVRASGDVGVNATSVSGQVTSRSTLKRQLSSTADIGNDARLGHKGALFLAPSPLDPQRLESEPSWTTCSGSTSTRSAEGPEAEDTRMAGVMDPGQTLKMLKRQEQDADHGPPSSLRPGSPTETSVSEQSEYSIAVDFNSVTWPETPISGTLTDYTMSPRGSIVARLKPGHPSIPPPPVSVSEIDSLVPPVFGAAFEYGKPYPDPRKEVYELHRIRPGVGSGNVSGGAQPVKDSTQSEHQPNGQSVYKPYRPSTGQSQDNPLNKGLSRVDLLAKKRDEGPPDLFRQGGSKAAQQADNPVRSTAGWLPYRQEVKGVTNAPLTGSPSTASLSDVKASNPLIEMIEIKPTVVDVSTSGADQPLQGKTDKSRASSTGSYGLKWMRRFFQRRATKNQSTKPYPQLTARPPGDGLVADASHPDLRGAHNVNSTSGGRYLQEQRTQSHGKDQKILEREIDGLEAVLKEALLIANQAVDNNDVTGLESVFREATAVRENGSHHAALHERHTIRSESPKLSKVPLTDHGVTAVKRPEVSATKYGIAPGSAPKQGKKSKGPAGQPARTGRTSVIFQTIPEETLSPTAAEEEACTSSLGTKSSGAPNDKEREVLESPDTRSLADDDVERGQPRLSSPGRRRASTLGRTRRSLHGRRYIGFGDARHPSLRGQHPRQATARDWSVTRKRLAASVACVSTAFVGLAVGIYAGEMPAIEFQIADGSGLVMLGNVLFYLGLALSTLCCWSLPLRYGRKPYVLGALALFLPLQLPQAIAVSSPRSPQAATYRFSLLLARALSGIVLGFANINFQSTLLDVFDTSVQGIRPRDAVPSERGRVRAGDGIGLWLGLWSWCFIASVGLGFLVGTVVTSGLNPAWGFWVVVMLGSVVLFLNVLVPEVCSGVGRSTRPGHEPTTIHPPARLPNWWAEVAAGFILNGRMLWQPGFAVLTVYVGWLYAQVVMLIMVLSQLLSGTYGLKPQHVGLCMMAPPLGSLVAIPLHRALFGRTKRATRGDGMTMGEPISWHSRHLRQAILTLLLPLATLGLALSMAGRSVHFLIPTVLTGLVAFLTTAAMTECYGVITDTYDVPHLPTSGLGHRTGSQTADIAELERSSNSPTRRIGAAWAIVQASAFMLAAAGTAAGGMVKDRFGIQAAAGIAAGVSLVLTISLLAVLWPWKIVHIIPSAPLSVGTHGDEAERQAAVVDLPESRTRKMNLLELGPLSRWTEMRRLH